MSRTAASVTGPATAPADRGLTAGVAAGPGLGWWSRALPAAALAALLVYLALTPLPPFSADVYGSLARRYAVLSGALLGYAVWLVVRRRQPGRTSFDLPLAAVTLALLLGVAGSADRRASLEAVLPLLPALVLVYLINDLRGLTPRALAWAVVVAATAVALFALASVWRALDEWWTLVRAVEGSLSRATLLPPETPRVADTGNHPNVLGAFFAMALPAALFLVVGEARRTMRISAALAGLVVAAALFFTLSRAAWLGAAAGLIVTGAGVLFAEGRGALWSRRIWLIVGTPALALTLVCFTSLAGGARPDWLFRDSLSPRADMRRAGWEMFLDNPLTGAGPGLFAARYPLYDGAHPFAAVHAHNLLVQTAVDTGVLGLGAGALFIAVVAWMAVSGYRTGDRATRAAIATTAGMLTALPGGGAQPGRRSRMVPAWLRSSWRLAGWSGPLLALTLAVLLPAAWLVTVRPHRDYSRGLDLAGEGRWPEAVAAARRATSGDERLAAYWFQLGAAHASAAIDGDRRTEQELALDAYRRGLDLEPHNGAALVNYAALNVALGRPDAARATLPALARLAGRDSLLLLAHATLTQWTAASDEAIETYAGLLVLNPTLAGTPFWRDGSFRQTNFERIVDRALARVPEVAGDGPAARSLRSSIALYAGRGAPEVATVRAALAERPNDVGLRVASGKLLMGSPDTLTEAGALLREAVRITGDDPAARAALGDWHARTGNLAAARREWTAASYLGDPGATVALGASFAPGRVPDVIRQRAKRQLLGAEIARFYLIFQTARFTFQRQEPHPIILPGDWLLALPDDVARWKQTIEAWE